MLETGASGSVGGKGGNILVYPASRLVKTFMLKQAHGGSASR
jgi:hypothetical protein